MTDDTIIHSNTTFKIKSKIYKKHKSRYIKIKYNQLRVFESLFIDGGCNKKYIDSKNKLRYSEHAGLLDFGKSTLQRIVVNAIPSKTDILDDEILFPDNLPDYFDFEYMFHTHPSTPNPGSRVIEGILYEFPSIPDLEQFIDFHNRGIMQGSMIFAPEGLYIIKCIDPTKRIIINNERKVFNIISKKFFEIQDLAIENYGNKFSEEDFYKIISKNRKYLDMYNSTIKKINLKILYYPRKKKYNNWIIDSFYLKVNPIE